MIHLLNEQGTKIRSFQNVDELFDYINATENAKLLEDHPQFGQTNWSFIIFSPKTVFELYHKKEKELLRPAVRTAYDQKLGLIEICTGNIENPAQIPITRDIDIKTLKKNWCFGYCKAQGFSVETEDSTNFSPDIVKVVAGEEGSQ